MPIPRTEVLLMALMPDLKLCQIEALKNFEHDDSFFINLRVKCPKREHRAGTSLHRAYMSGAVYELAKNELLRELCKGCKEVIDDADGV